MQDYPNHAVMNVINEDAGFAHQSKSRIPQGYDQQGCDFNLLTILDRCSVSDIVARIPIS